MSNISLLRLLVGMIGVIVCFLGLLNLLVAWGYGESTATSLTVSIVGAVMWLQAVPVLQASDRAERRKRIRDLYTKDGD
jgi:hypothetical protein